MGCAQSVPLQSATTSDEQARPHGGRSQGPVQQPGTGPSGGILGSDSELPNVVPDGAAAAAPSSHGARAPAPAATGRSTSAQPSPQAAQTSLSEPALPPSATDSSTERPARQQPSADTTPAELQSALPMLKDLLARISTPQPPPPGLDNRKLALIVWDIENVRCPRGNGPWDPVLTPAKVLGYIKNHFIYEPGRVEYRTVAAVTPKSLNIMRKKYPDFVDQVVPELTLLIASSEEPKRNADVMLKKELYRFVSEHSHVARHSPGQLTVVLISGDEDFLEPVQVALNSGFAVELMHHDQPSWVLHSQLGYSRPPLLWQDFLKQRSGADRVNLPYSSK